MPFLASQLLQSIRAPRMEHLWHCVYTTPAGERAHGEPSYPRREAVALVAGFNAITTAGQWSAERRRPRATAKSGELSTPKPTENAK